MSSPAPLNIAPVDSLGNWSQPWREYFNQSESYDFLGLKTFSGSSSETLILHNAAKYTKIVIELFDVIRGSSTTLLLRTSANGGSSFATSSGDYRWAIDYLSGASASPTNANSSSTGTSIQLSGTNSTNAIQGKIEIYSADTTTTKTMFLYDTICAQTYPERVRGAGQRDIAAAVNAIQILPGTGTITSGAMLAYGVKRQI